MKIMTRPGNSGVTLVELLVVIAIIGILVVALAFSYQGWRGNYQIESQIKNIYSDLMEARTKALTRNIIHFAVINATDYQIYEDTNSSGAYEAGDTAIFPQQKTIQYGFQLVGISDALPVTVNVDTRGLLSLATRALTAPASFRIDSTGLTPDYDCIILSQTSIRTGKFNGSSCDEK